MDDLDALPGADLVRRGLADLADGRSDTVCALLVGIARPRLQRLGLDVPPAPDTDLELRLFRTLAEHDEDTAYGRYNALLSRLQSFAHALEREVGTAARS